MFLTVRSGPLKTRKCQLIAFRMAIYPRLTRIQPALLMDFLNTPEKRERRLVHLPMGRFGEAVELAQGALFRASIFACFMIQFPNSRRSSLLATVASDESSYVTVNSLVFIM